MTAPQVPDAPQSWTLSLPWDKPPLHLNQRIHWAKENRLKREIKDTVGWLAKQAKIPPCPHITVCLHWEPGSNRARDHDNPMVTQKYAVDALVLVGVVPDDTPEYVTQIMPVIEPVRLGAGSCWLVVTAVSWPVDGAA